MKDAEAHIAYGTFMVGTFDGQQSFLSQLNLNYLHQPADSNSSGNLFLPTTVPPQKGHGLLHSLHHLQFTRKLESETLQILILTDHLTFQPGSHLGKQSHTFDCAPLHCRIAAPPRMRKMLQYQTSQNLVFPCGKKKIKSKQPGKYFFSGLISSTDVNESSDPHFSAL